MATRIGELDVTPTPTVESTSEDAEAGEEFEDDDMEVSSIAINKDLEEDDRLSIHGDLNLDLELLKRIPCLYTDIIAEFADVEIFMISVDSLLLELSSLHYLNWVLGGQTAALAEQINQFLTALDDLNAKFILVWFANLKPLYEKDQFLQFLHSFVIGYLSQSKWADAIECFQNPLDEKWTDFLYRLTPSFLLVFMENPSETFVQEEIDFATRFISIAIQLITSAIPMVFFNGFTINFSSVMASRLSTVSLSITNLEAKIAAIWEGACEKPVQNEAQLSAIYACKSVAEFWAVIMKEELRNSKKDDGFEEFCNAVLISSLACEKLRTARTYFFEDAKEAQKGPPPAANHSRRRLFAAATTKLESVDWSKLTFSLADLWDGRMILGIYRKVIAKAEILPFRLQDEFSKLHQLVGLKMAVPTDTNDKLLDPLSTPEKKAQKLHIDELKLCKTDNKLLNEFMPEAQECKRHEKLEAKKLSLPSKTRLKMSIKRLKVMGEWKWSFTKDDNCGICRARFEACCTECKFPGDDCPVVMGQCKHAFHMHCIAKWTNSQAQQSRAACPLCRQEWKYL